MKLKELREHMSHSRLSDRIFDLLNREGKSRWTAYELQEATKASYEEVMEVIQSLYDTNQIIPQHYAGQPSLYELRRRYEAREWQSKFKGVK